MLKKVFVFILVILFCFSSYIYSEDIFEVIEVGSFEEIENSISNIEDINELRRYADSLLQVAIINERDPKIIELLIENGADVNVYGEVDNTTLMTALSVHEDIKVSELLIDAGVDVNKSNAYGLTPLMVASVRTYEKTKLLINKRARVNDISYTNGTTALLRAKENNNQEIIELLKENGAILHPRDENGNTPLMHAAKSGNLERVKLLLELGAEVNITNNFGETPLMFAAHGEPRSSGYNSEEIIDLLIKSGASINAKNNEGFTPIMYSVLYNFNQEATEELLKHGADTSIKNKNGDTVIDIARKENKNIQYLLQDDILAKEWTISEIRDPHIIEAGNDFIYVASHSNLYKIDTNGNIIWLFDKHENLISDIEIGKNGYIYTGSFDETVRKIDENGSQIWQFEGHFDRYYDKPVLTISVDERGYVYSGSYDKTIRKISPGGEEKWLFYWPWAEGYALNSINIEVDNNGFLYISGRIMNSFLMKINKNHKPSIGGVFSEYIWMYTDEFYRRDVGLEVDNSGNSYINNRETIRKIDNQGNEIWRTSFFQSEDYSSDNYTFELEYYNDHIYTIGIDKKIRKLNSDGDLIWEYLSQNLIYDFSINENGEIYIITEGHKIIKLVQ